MGSSSDLHAYKTTPYTRVAIPHRFSSLRTPTTAKLPFAMNEYRLHHDIQTLRVSVGAMAFSPDGRFLLVGSGLPDCLQVFDCLAGYFPTIKADALSRPTAFSFETFTTFLAGHGDGRFAEYTIDLKSKRLVQGWTNSILCGPSPIASMALNETSKVLALVVGPSVFIFTRVPETGKMCCRTPARKLTFLPGEFQFAANISSHFNIGRDPTGRPPAPTSLCFSSNGQLHVAFRLQHVA